MNEVKFKIFDFEKLSFVNNPSKYIKFKFFNGLKNEIYVVPCLKPNLPAKLFLSIGKQDSTGLEIFEEDIVYFYDLEFEDYLTRVVTRKEALFYWTLDERHFENASNLKILAHSYESPLQIFKNLL